MNVFELITTSAKNYLKQLQAYSTAGMALLLASAVVLGWLSGMLLVDMAIALAAGGEYGAWTGRPKIVAAMAAVTLAGMTAVSLLGFSVWGGFLNLCHKIMQGSKEAGLAEFAGYGIMRWKTFFAIGIVQMALGSLFSIPGAIAWIFAGPLFGIPLILIAHYASAGVFFFAYAAAVVDGCGALAAITRSLKTVLYKPVAAVATYVLCAIVIFAPMILLPLYPAYYYIAAMPIIAIVQLGYYQRAKGAN